MKCIKIDLKSNASPISLEALWLEKVGFPYSSPKTIIMEKGQNVSFWERILGHAPFSGELNFPLWAEPWVSFFCASVFAPKRGMRVLCNVPGWQ